MAESIFLERGRVGLIFFVMNTTLALFMFSFIPLFLKEQGYTFWQLILLYVGYTTLASLFVMVVSVFRVKQFIAVGFLLHCLAAFSFFWFSPATIYIYLVLLGLIATFYWVPLNYLFFEHSQKETNATRSSGYYLIFGLISVVVPLLGVAVIQRLGYHWLFGLTAVLYVIPFLMAVKIIPEERKEAHFWQSFRSFKGLRTITFFEGSLHFFGGVILPVYGLLFLRSEGEVGTYLSYLGLLGVVLALFLSRKSDISQERKKYLYALLFLMGISIVSFMFVQTKFGWYLAVSFFTVISTISAPLRLAVSMDVKEVDLWFWKIREFSLNVGRATTLAIAAFFFYYGLYFPVFILFALIALSYPLLVSYKLKNVR